MKKYASNGIWLKFFDTKITMKLNRSFWDVLLAWKFLNFEDTKLVQTFLLYYLLLNIKLQKIWGQKYKIFKIEGSGFFYVKGYLDSEYVKEICLGWILATGVFIWNKYFGTKCQFNYKKTEKTQTLHLFPVRLYIINMIFKSEKITYLTILYLQNNDHANLFQIRHLTLGSMIFFLLNVGF